MIHGPLLASADDCEYMMISASERDALFCRFLRRRLLFPVRERTHIARVNRVRFKL